MSAIDTVVRGSKRIESMLEERLGASGRGLTEKVLSVEQRLPPDIVRSVRWIATARNKVVHEDGHAAFDAQAFADRVDETVEWLALNTDAAAAPPTVTVASSAVVVDGIELVRGKVASVRRLGRSDGGIKGMATHGVQIEIAGVPRVIELTVEEAVVINHGDDVAIAGEPDAKSGKLRGYAYRNVSKGIFGQHKDTTTFGYVFVAAGLFLCWAIFPLFFHLPTGRRLIRLGETIRRAAAAVAAI